MSKVRDNISSDKGEALKKFYQSCVAGLNNFKAEKPRAFLEELGLTSQLLGLGFSSGQFHHRKTEEFRAPFVKAGILIPSDAAVNQVGLKAYSTFAAYGILFPMKNESGELINFYGHRIKVEKNKGAYLNNEGVYPQYPSKNTSRLFITENVIDAATIIQSEILETGDAVLALEEGQIIDAIRSAIKGLNSLRTVIHFSTTEMTEKVWTNSDYRVLRLPDVSSLNEFWLLYGTDGLKAFIEEKTYEVQSHLQVISDREFYFEGKELSYNIYGQVSENPTFLEMDFSMVSEKHNVNWNIKLNLLNSDEVKQLMFEKTEGKNFNYSQIILELELITTELQKLRKVNSDAPQKKGFSPKVDKHAKELLQSDELFDELNAIIGKAGIVGEQDTRLLLFIIASSYKFRYNLHGVIHTDDIGAGAELVSKVAALIPEMDRYEIDVTTSRTFRYYGNSMIDNKLLVIPDYSGITSSRAIGDLKRLHSKGSIVIDAPLKGADGFLYTDRQVVKGHNSSIGACTSSKRYFESEPRTVIVGMDTSVEQTTRLMEYDCMLMSGSIKQKDEERARELLQYVIRNTYPLEVVNPHSSSMMLPASIPNARMLTLQLHNFVSLITLFNQHQRKKDNHGRVIAQKKDVKTAVNLFLDAIMVNIDELDASTRDFFDRLKVIMKSGPKGQDTKLSSLEVRQAMRMSKSSVNRFLKILVDYEYIKKEGYRNTGYVYRIVNWKELNLIKQMIESKLNGSGGSISLGSPEAA